VVVVGGGALSTGGAVMCGGSRGASPRVRVDTTALGVARAADSGSSNRPMTAASPIANTATAAVAHRGTRVARRQAASVRRGGRSPAAGSYITSGTRRLAVPGDESG